MYIAQPDSDLLLINSQDGTFADVSVTSGIANISRNSQGVAFGDYDTDGFLDIFVSCGNTPGGSSNDILWRNLGNGTFSDASSAAGIIDSSDGRSCVLFDVDNDMDVDIFVANAGAQNDLLYSNNGNGTFSKLLTQRADSSYGCAVADYDNDGDLDIVVTSDTPRFALYQNQCLNRNHIRVRPSSSVGGLDSFGAQVILRDHDTKQLVAMTQIDGGSGRGCQSQYDAHFGVPDGSHKYDIEVRFMLNQDGEQVVVDGTVNPYLNGITADDIDRGHVEIRENGRLLLSHGVVYAQGTDSRDIYTLPFLGGPPTQLTNTPNADDAAPNWAPDGQKLVFVRTQDSGSGPQGELYTIDADGMTQERLIFDYEWSTSNEVTPAWSSDGTQIAFATDRDGDYEVYVTNTGGRELRNLTENPARDTHPAWNASSSRIAFVSDRGAGQNHDIYTMNFDGSDVLRLTDHPGIDTEPSWHPNGIYLTFASNRENGVYQIYIMQFRGGFQKRLTFGSSNKHHPVFTNDGKRIIYESDGELYIMDFPGSDGDNGRVLDAAGVSNSDPHYPLLFRQPPKTIMFGVKDGRVMYWADPVNTHLGNYTRVDTDFILPGFGDPVVWTRTYNSQDTILGPLGYGWRFNYQIEVTEDVDGFITVTWGNGAQDFFYWNEIVQEYQPLEDRITHTFTKGGSAAYTLTTREGTVFEFLPIGVHAKSYDPDTIGKIARITDKNGHRTEFTYNETGLLTDVTQQNQRNLVVTWETHGTHGHRITKVEESIPGLTTPPRFVEYFYNDDGELERAVGKNGEYVWFEYDDFHRMIVVQALFDGVPGPQADERLIVRNEYDENGRVALQWDGNGNESALYYEEDEEGQFQTTVEDALGNTQQHIYDQYRRLVEYQDESGNVLQYGYDANGFKSHILDRAGNAFEFFQNVNGLPTGSLDPLGNITEVVYEDGATNPNAVGSPKERTVYVGDNDARTVSFTYDANGNLESITDPLGGAAVTRYHAILKGKPIETEDEYGNITYFTYDETAGDLIEIRNALGNVTRMDYDPNGRLIKVTRVMGGARPDIVTEYSYRADDQLSRIIDPMGNQINLEYYTGGKLKTIRNVLDHAVSFSYDSNLNIQTVIDPRGHVVTHTYDANNNITKISDSYQNQAREVTHEYDEQNRLKSTTVDPLGLNITTAYGYDVHGRVIVVTDARGQTFHREYNEGGEVSSTWTMVNSERIETFYEYNGAGELIKTTDPLGNITEYLYDELGRLIETRQALDGNTFTTLTEYYGTADNGVAGAFYGKTKLNTDINGRQITYKYDAIGRLTDTIDPIDRRTHYTYDAADRLIAADIDPDGAGFVTQREYDANGNVTRTITPQGDALDVEYDVLNRPVLAYLPYPDGGVQGGFAQYVYDQNGEIGRLTSVIDPNGNTTEFVHDEDGRVIQARDANAVAGPTNIVTTRTFDLAGRLINAVAASGSGDASAVSYQHDENGNLVQLTKQMGGAAPDQVHTFVYDALNRLTYYTDPLNRTTELAYNRIGLLLSRITPDGLNTTYEYDDLYRLKTVTYPDTSTAAYTYDNAGGHPTDLLSVVNSDLGTASWTYDGMGRVIGVTDRYEKLVGYAYDQFDRVQMLTYPGNLDVTYTYNNRNQITSVTDWLGNSAAYEYDDKGRLDRQVNSNNTRTVYTYQDNGWLQSLTNEKTDGPPGLGTPIAAYTLTTDNVGNRTLIVRDEPVLPFPSSESTSSTFDEGNQIGTDGTLDYEFDDRGNLVRELLGGALQKEYTYDYANRLIRVTDDPDGTPVVTDYTYDNASNRMATDHDEQVTHYTLDTSGMSQVLSENDAADNPQWYYIYGNGLTWRVKADSSETHFYHGDYISSVVAMTDGATGRVNQAYAYDAFGEVLNELDEGIQQPFQYVGVLGVQREENDLQFMRARYYHVQLSQFMSADPIFTLNHYMYAGANPVLQVDPRGLYKVRAGLNLSGGFFYKGDLFLGWEYDSESPLILPQPYFRVSGGLMTNIAGSATYRLEYDLGVEGDRVERGWEAGEKLVVGHSRIFNEAEGQYEGEAWQFGVGLGGLPLHAQETSEEWSADFSFHEFLAGFLADAADLAETELEDVGVLGYGYCSADPFTLASMNPGSPQDPGGGGGSGDDDLLSPSIDYANTVFGRAQRWAELNPEKAAAWNAHLFELEKAELDKKEDEPVVIGDSWEDKQRLRLLKQWRAREAAVRAQISVVTSGRGLDSMAGLHHLTYTYVGSFGINQSFLTDFWYTNVSRIVGMVTPSIRQEAGQKSMNAHATLVHAARTSVLANFGMGSGVNGRNTPFLPEVYEIEVVEGKTQPYVK